MLMPKKVKFRKQHRGRRAGRAKGGDAIAFGDFALQALEPGWVTARQIEAGRVAITRHVKRGGKIWVRVFRTSRSPRSRSRRAWDTARAIRRGGSR